MRLLGLGNNQESDKVRESPSLSAPTEKSSRLLFVGCDKVIGYHSVAWEDKEWPNAADFDAVLINGASLYELLNKWGQAKLDGHPHNVELCEGLVRNLEALKGEVLQIIKSQRSVFFFAVPDERIVVNTKETPRYRTNVAISAYDWNPIPIRIIEEKPGERLDVIDKRFADYSRQIKKWVLSFDTAELPYNIHTIRRAQYYNLSQSKPLIQNLSHNALAVELRYLEIEADSYGLNPISVGTSGPIYLLHYPVNGDFQVALRAVVREFFAIELIENSEPSWIETVDPPHGKRIGARLDQINAELEGLFEERTSLIEERTNYAKWRQLIYETGNVLELYFLVNRNPKWKPEPFPN